MLDQIDQLFEKTDYLIIAKFGNRWAYHASSSAEKEPN